nr:hypothetical protein HmN_000860200 [Hymenolepis microstoma]
MIVHPMKELELFQTDTQELTKELSDLADDCSSIHGDMHIFLTEHSISSTKRNNKHKRKTEKPTEATRKICPNQSHNAEVLNTSFYNGDSQKTTLTDTCKSVIGFQELQPYQIGQSTNSSTTVTVPISL